MKEGDFVRIEYVGRVSGTNEIFDLTSEDLARKEGIRNPKYRYGPVLVVIGARMIVPGVERKLLEMKPGEEREFDVPPEEGFGKRDVKRIKIVSTANFIRQKINPVPGRFVEINGRQAKIQSVSGGRVRVDFNHPLAGKSLRYKVKIVEVIEKPLERAKAILDYYRLECEAGLENGVLEVKTRETVQEPVRKLLSGVITRWVKEIKEVKFPESSGGRRDKKNI
jgi:FKBP-type peptidyl-prolyl cis-trans isomerase 2